MWIGVQIQLVEKFMLIEGIAGGRRKSIIKRPAVFQHQWIHDGNRNKRLQTFQFTENERAMRPGAGKGNVQMVTIFFCGESAFAGRSGRAVSGKPVAESRR
ncbi:hypothetical protein SEEC5569_15100 [Salmonella enterica subsp. enterica serovar Cerro str. 5569]|nr:hypothetical protein SEEC5569_15100 [Salmonella enterica subsp. enterica serovar Cerro str. 5569]